MKNFLLGLFLGIFISVTFADNISTPPPLPEESAMEQHYFEEIYRNFNNLKVVSSIPDATRNGKKGDMLLYISGSTYRLYLNVDSSTSWKYTTLN